MYLLTYIGGVGCEGGGGGSGAGGWGWGGVPCVGFHTGLEEVEFSRQIFHNVTYTSTMFTIYRYVNALIQRRRKNAKKRNKMSRKNH
jgi:hypothetical protein